ncbi:MAG TPA: hypothetical protein PLW65_20595 [Pseudomonadota bacterium]|nr:hypothetical protein [Pseudomonadota bacterium]
MIRSRFAYRGKGPLLIYRLARLAVVALLLIAGTASAAPSPTVLVLSVAEEGRQHDSLRNQVGELMQRAGARPIDDAGLTAANRACQEPVCLGKLAEDHRAELILAARIERRSRHERLVDMWLYEAKSGSDQSERGLCDVRDMKDCVTSLAGKLIAPQLDGSAPREGKEPGPAALIASSKAPARRASRPGWRIGLGVGLTTLALGALATGIGTSVLQGQAGPTGSCPQVGQEMGCAYNFMPLSTPSYVAAGVLAVGAILSFSLPAARAQQKEKQR